ncbi:hypothetical protein Amet_0468 [Alkaliphilus metalliredigens QYMF]|uniref:Uncharacterized protein n=1 Tax=Alkaliphilus metalliredigens (strain QYMF) TaxID=293826 RepID=A6TKH8_ALKMQ|nr:hypothetical protein [Alkaliphilus metalliredigens]ABR46696.1 hypothetical protein Amet_0468 [Alkaliphilus metalliredigens QYMF]
MMFIKSKVIANDKQRLPNQNLLANKDQSKEKDEITRGKGSGEEVKGQIRLWNSSYAKHTFRQRKFLEWE